MNGKTTKQKTRRKRRSVTRIPWPWVQVALAGAALGCVAMLVGAAWSARVPFAADTVVAFPDDGVLVFNWWRIDERRFVPRVVVAVGLGLAMAAGLVLTVIRVASRRALVCLAVILVTGACWIVQPLIVPRGDDKGHWLDFARRWQQQRDEPLIGSNFIGFNRTSRAVRRQRALERMRNDLRNDLRVRGVTDPHVTLSDDGMIATATDPEAGTRYLRNLPAGFAGSTPGSVESHSPPAHGWWLHLVAPGYPALGLLMLALASLVWLVRGIRREAGQLVGRVSLVVAWTAVGAAGLVMAAGWMTHWLPQLAAIILILLVLAQTAVVLALTAYSLRRMRRGAPIARPRIQRSRPGSG